MVNIGYLAIHSNHEPVKLSWKKIEKLTLQSRMDECSQITWTYRQMGATKTVRCSHHEAKSIDWLRMRFFINYSSQFVNDDQL